MRLTAFALALMAAAAAAQEPEITFHFQEVEAAKVLEVIEATAGKKVALDAEYADRKITIEMKNLAVDKAVEVIAKKLGAVVYGGSRILPAWRRDMLVKLDTKRVKKLDWKAKDITFSGAIQYMRAVTGLNFALDPKLGGKLDMEIELHVNDIPARSMLDFLCEPAGIAWDVRYGVVFLAEKGRLGALPALTPWKYKALDEKRIDVPFDAVKLPVALNFMAAATGAKFKLAPDAMDAAKAIEVTFVASRIRASDVLANLLLPHGFSMERDKEGVYHVSLK